MRLGFYTNYTPEIAQFAQKIGFKSMELSAWPGSSLDADQVSDQQIAEIRKDLQVRDIEISTLGYYPNYQDPDLEERKNARRYFIKVLDLAKKMEVGIVSTFAGRDPSKSVADNIPLFKEVFTVFCEEAEKRGIKIAIENCPMMDQVHMQGTNIAFSPEIWDVMYEAVPSRSLGIELDPAHMVWLGIDYIQAIHDYGNRIFHVHAKDMEIRKDALAHMGIFGQCFGEVFGLGHGWWRARTPGWGQVDWPKFITALLEENYKGNIDIEHEDDVFAMSALKGEIQMEADIVDQYGQEKGGLILGYNTLSRLIPS